MRKILSIILLLLSINSFANPPQRMFKEKYQPNVTEFYIISSTQDTIELKKVLPSNTAIGWIQEDTYKNRLIHASDYQTKTTFLIQIKVNDEISNTEYYSLLNQISRNDKIVQVGESFLFENKIVGTSGYLFVMLKKQDDFNLLKRTAKKFNYEIVGQNPLRSNWYMLRPIQNGFNSICLALDKIESENLFEAVEAELYATVDFSCGNNGSLFADQWGLNNTGQNGGTPGVDIQLCNAWNITKGDPDVLVAVFDTGVEFTHSAFTGNLYGGYNALTGTTPSSVYVDPSTNLPDSHGTNCAGIIAGLDNGNGYTGIAPQCKILPISFSGGTATSNAMLADGFAWARNHNADIISCSWHWNATSLQIEQEIDLAINTGRGGKGCVVVFASGNANQSSCTYPGNYNSNILCVGAIDRCGFRSNSSAPNCEPWGNGGSNYGQSLDVMAPGTHIASVDLLGSAGENTSSGSAGDYVENLNGTSFACPMVSGVAALILSANPNLTQLQVQQIIESTAIKFNTNTYSYTNNSNRPNGTWNEEMGYGVINAYSAVNQASILPTCNASVVLTTPSGTLKDHITPGGYGNNNNCEWLIQPAGAAQIFLWFTNFSTVDANDVLKIYDGPNSNATLLGTYFGNNLPPFISSSTGSVYLNFITNSTYTSTGWQLQYYTANINTTLNDYEYWFDTNYADKVVGNNTASTSIAEYIFNANVPNTLSPNQIHAFHFRCKDDVGRWSSVITHDFYQTGASNLIAYEYWFDNNIADKTVVNFSSPYAQINLNPGNTTVNTSALSNGLHSFHFRTKSENGMWSSALTHDFYKVAEGTLSGYEYWFDDDYAARISTSTPISSIIDITEFNTLFSTIGLANGLHQFNFRAKSQNGYWSSVVSHHFYKLGGSGLVAYQYWFDHDYSNANTWNASGPSQQFNINPLNAVFSLANLSSGLHQFHFRTLDEGGSWSAVLSQDFYILGGKLTQYEYWFNADYASRIDNAFSPTDDYQIQSTLNVTSLPLGSNLLHVRFKNNQGVWSSVMTQGFCKGLGDSSISIRFFIEGYYTGNNTMQAVLFNQGVSSDLTISDSLEVQLRGDTYPYPVVGSKYVSQKTNGLVELDLPNVPAGYYYVVIKHRNALETWSANTLYKGDCSLSYDFTTAANKAFGDNQKEVAPGVFALYSGDNFQDGSIDAFDYLDMAPDIINGNSGFLSTDLNGDGVVDAFDYLILDPNIQSGLGAMMP